MRRLLAATTALLFVLALAACSDDGDDEGSAPDDSLPPSAGLVDSGVASDEFCAEVEANADVLSSLGGDAEAGDAAAAVDQLIQDAPEVIVPSLETLRDTFEQLESGESDLGDLFGGELIGAIEQVALFVEGECDVQLATPSSGAVGDAPDEAGSADELDPAAVRAHLEEQDPDLETRLEAVSSVEGLEINVTVRGLVVGEDGDEAVAICEALSEYAYDEVGDPDLTLRVQTTDTDDVATREGEDGQCTAA